MTPSIRNDRGRKMINILVALLATIVLTSADEVTEPPANVDVNTNASCGPDETACAFGCCPLPNANCCWYGTQCCPSGYTCIIGFCARNMVKNEKASMKYKEGTAVKNVLTQCPSGTTSCGKGKCCPFEQAVCCSDGIHCCPNSYTCDLVHDVCVKNSPSEDVKQEVLSFPPLKSLNLLREQSVAKEVKTKATCGFDETECAFGCCPLPNANCCWYGTQCCPAGYTCIIGFCVRSMMENEEPSLKYEEGTALKNVVTTCPPGTSSCGKEKCCPFEHAICCSDGSHCCPKGYTCDLEHNLCVKTSLSGVSDGKQEVLSFPPLKTFSVQRNQPVLKVGDYGCAVGDNCCRSVIGQMCCPSLKLCTWLGCI